MAKYNYGLKQCVLCGCDILKTASAKYCISCGIKVRKEKQREKYLERAAAKKSDDKPVNSTTYKAMAAVFRKYGYPMVSYEKYMERIGERVH